MNYWPAEAANLGICHKPLFEFMKVLTKPAQLWLRALQLPGLGAASTPIFGAEPLVNHSNHGIWPTGERGSAPISGSTTSIMSDRFLRGILPDHAGCRLVLHGLHGRR